MKTITYLCLGAAALCGVAIATPQPGQQGPVAAYQQPARAAALSSALSTTSATDVGIGHPRADALAAISSPSVAASLSRSPARRGPDADAPRRRRRPGGRGQTGDRAPMSRTRRVEGSAPQTGSRSRRSGPASAFD